MRSLASNHLVSVYVIKYHQRARKFPKSRVFQEAIPKTKNFMKPNNVHYEMEPQFSLKLS